MRAFRMMNRFSRPFMNLKPVRRSAIRVGTITTATTTATFAETLKEKSENPLYIDAFVRCDKELRPELCKETVNHMFDLRKHIESKQSDDPAQNSVLYTKIEENLNLININLMKKCSVLHKEIVCDEAIRRAFAISIYSLGSITIPDLDGVTINMKVTDIDKLLANSKEHEPIVTKISFSP